MQRGWLGPGVDGAVCELRRGGLGWGWGGLGQGGDGRDRGGGGRPDLGGDLRGFCVLEDGTGLWMVDRGFVGRWGLRAEAWQLGLRARCDVPVRNGGSSGASDG